jgi:DNA polymerase-1
LGREIRKAFIAKDKWQLMAADYSQIELRILAAVSDDPGLKEAFEQGLDIHAATAARVYDVELEAVDSEMRRKARWLISGFPMGFPPLVFPSAWGFHVWRQRKLSRVISASSRDPGLHR